MIDVFPLNLVLAVAVAWATIFLGFLPTKNLRTGFFAREAAKAGVIWTFVMLTSDRSILHLLFMVAIFCFFAWWQLNRDRPLSGKIWLSLASGLGISIGVMLILALEPKAYPPGLSPLYRGLLLGSIYLGGAVIGLAYVSARLIRARVTQAEVNGGTILRYAYLLIALTIARALVVLVHAYLVLELLGRMHAIVGGPAPMLSTHAIVLLILTVLVLPALAVTALRLTRGGTPEKAIPILAVMSIVGIGTEWLARLLTF